MLNFFKVIQEFFKSIQELLSFGWIGTSVWGQLLQALALLAVGYMVSRGGLIFALMFWFFCGTVTGLLAIKTGFGFASPEGSTLENLVSIPFWMATGAILAGHFIGSTYFWTIVRGMQMAEAAGINAIYSILLGVGVLIVLSFILDVVKGRSTDLLRFTGALVLLIGLTMLAMPDEVRRLFKQISTFWSTL